MSQKADYATRRRKPMPSVKRQTSGEDSVVVAPQLSATIGLELSRDALRVVKVSRIRERRERLREPHRPFHTHWVTR